VLDLLKGMIRIRHFEDKCAELYTQQKIRGFLHLYDGEEAIAAGVIPVLAIDRIVATYREHGHALVRGVPMNDRHGRDVRQGRGLLRRARRLDAPVRCPTEFYGGNAIVGGGLPLAGGLALADKMRGEDRVTACFFGEGAVAEGEFHETLNLAELWDLPVCSSARTTATPWARPSAARIRDRHPRQGGRLRHRLRSRRRHGRGRRRGRHPPGLASDPRDRQPYFLECRTYRFRAHSMFDAQLYRDKEEIASGARRGRSCGSRDGCWRTADPGQRHRPIEARVDAEIAEAVAFAEAGTWEPVETLTRHVVGEPAPAPVPATPSGETGRDHLSRGGQAGDPRRDDPRRAGVPDGRGCRRLWRLLRRDQGADGRVRRGPHPRHALSESGFTGAGIGAAAAGMRPIVELMTVNFSLLALDQIMNTAATIRHMSGGQFGVPLVIRMATGAGKQLAAQHSHSLEGWYAHIPG
jgi:2-oxoisovalerate dehydrogenase E1 component